METSKKIILFLLTLFFIQSCKDKKDINLKKINSFFVLNHNPYQHKPLPVNSNKVKFLKANLYLYNKKLYIGIDYKIKEFDKKNNSIKIKIQGIILLDSIIKLSSISNSTKISINVALDTTSYKKKSDNIYIDKNNVYAISYTPFLGEIYILDINVNKLKIINNEYICDDKNIYCIHSRPVQIKTKYPKSFKIINYKKIVLAVDSSYIYSMCEPMSPEYFLKEFESIPFVDRVSIVKKHFSNLSELKNK